MSPLAPAIALLPVPRPSPHGVAAVAAALEAMPAQGAATVPGVAASAELPSGLWQTASRTTAASIMQRAVQTPARGGVSLATMWGAVDQALMDERLLRLVQLDRCFNRMFYFGQGAGVPLVNFEDEAHKLKNALHGMQGQPDPTVDLLEEIAGCINAGQAFPVPPGTPLPALVAVAKSQPAFRALVPALLGATDKQNVATAQHVFTNLDFIAAVNAAGFCDAALVLLVIGRACEAFDMRGLTKAERDQRLHDRDLLCAKLLQPYLFQAKSPPQIIAGLSSSLLCAFIGNSDSRQQLMCSLPPEQQLQLVERFGLTDISESMFSAVKAKAGRRPTPSAVLRAIGAITVGIKLRTMPRNERRFDVSHSKRNPYPGVAAAFDCMSACSHMCPCV